MAVARPINPVGVYQCMYTYLSTVPFFVRDDGVAVCALEGVLSVRRPPWMATRQLIRLCLDPLVLIVSR